MNAPSELETHLIEASRRPHAGTLIVLHGLGVDYRDLLPIAEELRLPGLRYVYVNATWEMPGYFGGRGWYDMPPGHETGVKVSRELLTAVIEAQIAAGEPAESIGILGFSQGAVMALETGLRFLPTLKTVVALSGYLHDMDWPASAPAENREIPLLIAHGETDELVPASRGRQMNAVLQDAGWQTVYKEYPHGHGVSPEEIGDIRAFLLQIFGEGAG